MSSFWLMMGLSVLPLAWLLAPVLYRRWQRQQVLSRPFPARWRRILRRHVPMAARLPADLQLRLKQQIQVFIAETPFLGCAGLRVSNTMRVVVAAQACLLLLGRGQGRFHGLRQILLYPGPFIVNRNRHLDAGVWQEQRQVLSGESWSLGQVILSWPDCLHGAADPDDGSNVVIHEFAHQLDHENGDANGSPPRPRSDDPARWARVFQSAYEQLRYQLRYGLPTPLSSYAASSPAEFFAVASEVFFEQPQPLAQAFPELYAELSAYYRLDPASWQGLRVH